MRVATMAALMLAAAIAWADEPPATEAEAEAAAQATEATPEKAVEPATATEATAAEGTAAPAAETVDDQPFKVPAGYRAKTIGGKQMYCKNVVVLGSRFGKESCRTETQLREIERQKEPALNQDNPACTGGACASK